MAKITTKCMVIIGCIALFAMMIVGVVFAVNYQKQSEIELYVYQTDVLENSKIANCSLTFDGKNVELMDDKNVAGLKTAKVSASHVKEVKLTANGYGYRFVGFYALDYETYKANSENENTKDENVKALIKEDISVSFRASKYDKITAVFVKEDVEVRYSTQTTSDGDIAKSVTENVYCGDKLKTVAGGDNDNTKVEGYTTNKYSFLGYYLVKESELNNRTAVYGEGTVTKNAEDVYIFSGKTYSTVDEWYEVKDSSTERLFLRAAWGENTPIKVTYSIADNDDTTDETVSTVKGADGKDYTTYSGTYTMMDPNVLFDEVINNKYPEGNVTSENYCWKEKDSGNYYEIGGVYNITSNITLQLVSKSKQ